MLIQNTTTLSTLELIFQLDYKLLLDYFIGKYYRKASNLEAAIPEFLL